MLPILLKLLRPPNASLRGFFRRSWLPLPGSLTSSSSVLLARLSEGTLLSLDTRSKRPRSENCPVTPSSWTWKSRSGAGWALRGWFVLLNRESMVNRGAQDENPEATATLLIAGDAACW